MRSFLAVGGGDRVENPNVKKGLLSFVPKACSHIHLASSSLLADCSWNTSSWCGWSLGSVETPDAVSAKSSAVRSRTVGTEIMFPQLRANFDTTSLEVRHNSLQLQHNFARTSTQLCSNFDSTSLELRHNSLQLRHNFAQTSTQFAPTWTQLCSNFDTASLELRLNFARTSI